MYTARSEDRDRLAAYLKAEGIGTRNVYPPIHSQKAYSAPEFEDQKIHTAVPSNSNATSEAFYPVTTEIAARGLWLPSSTKLSDDEIDRVCSIITSFFKNERKSRL